MALVRRFSAVCALSLLAAVPSLHAATVFVPLNPCRAVDTRQSSDGDLSLNETRDFFISGAVNFSATGVDQGGNAAGCGVPAGAIAASLNVVAVDPNGKGNLGAWEFGETPQLAAIINYSQQSGQNVANNLMLPITGVGDGMTPDLTIIARLVTSVHVVIDVTGYFLPVAGGPGVDVSGDDGPITITLDAGQQLPTNCDTNDPPEWDGDSWVCGDDAVGGGTGMIQSITGEDGVVVTNGTGPDTTIGLDESVLLPGGCTEGQVVVKAAGAGWTCMDLGGGAGDGVAAAYAVRHNQLSTSSGTTHYGPAGSSHPTDVQSTLPATQRIEIISPESSCVAHNLLVRQVHQTTGAAVNLTGGATRTFTLLVDGSPSALECTIDAMSQSTCLSDPMDTVTLSQGQRLAIRDVNGNSGSYPAADALMSWECVSQ